MIDSCTPPKCNIPPEKWWLEDDPFLLGPGHFFRGELLNFGRVSGQISNPRICTAVIVPLLGKVDEG